MYNDTTDSHTHRANDIDTRRTTTGGLVPLDSWADSFGQTTGERHDVQGWTLRTWEHDESQPETRDDLPFAHAVAMATRGGFARAQVIDPRTDSIHIES